MPGDSRLALPGSFDPGKTYLMSGATLAAWQKAILADRVIAGQNLREIVTPQGRVLHAQAGGGGTTVTGAFHRIFAKSDGHTYLQGGTVTGGSGTVTIPDIKLIDGSLGIQGDPGEHLYIEATGDGVTADDVLLAGWNLSTATPGTASSVPANTLPTAASASGKKAHISLGTYTASGFLPSAIGDIQISFCPGSYFITRAAHNAP